MPHQSDPPAPAPQHSDEPIDAASHDDDGIASDDDSAALSPSDGYFHNPNAPSQAVAAGLDDAISRRQGRTADGQQVRAGGISINVPHVPNVLVEDPTLRQSSAEAKAQEAAEETSRSGAQNDQQSPDQTRNDSGSQSHQASTPLRTVQTPASAGEITPVVEDTVEEPSSPSRPTSPLSPNPTRHSDPERTPLIRRHDHGARRTFADAPPAYSRNPPTTYQTINYNARSPSTPSQPEQIPGEEEPLLSTDTQFMGTPFPEPELPVSLVFWRRFSKVTERPNLRKRVVVVLSAIVFFIIICILTITYLMSNHHKHDYVEEPVQPPEPDVPKDGEMHWRPLANCRKSEQSRITGRQTYTFSAEQHLTILEVTSKEDGGPNDRPVHIFGDLIIRPGGSSTSYSAGSIVVESIANQAELGPMIGWDRGTQTFKVTNHRDIPWDSRDGDPCMQVRITMYVPPGAMLGSLSLQSQNLNIKAQEGLVLSVTNEVDLVVTSGNIIFPFKAKNESLVPYRLEGRVISVQTTVGNLRGWFPMYDTLVLATHSGNIVAEVGQKLPKQGREGASLFAAESHAGNITVSESPADGLSGRSRLREHHVVVQTESGSVDIETFYTSVATISTQTGDIKLSAWPAADSDCVRWGRKYCTIATETRLGATNVTVNPPPNLDADIPDDTHDVSAGGVLHNPPANLTCLRSGHISTSGKISAKYPQAWQGTVMGSTLEGNLSYHGRDLVMKRWDAVNRRVKGIKGEGESILVLSTLTGDQEVLVGEAEEEAA